MSRKKQKIYMQYFCKNDKCGRIFLDEDLRGRILPEKWKYCPECVAKLGFANPDKPPQKELSKKQREVLHANSFKAKK